MKASTTTLFMLKALCLVSMARGSSPITPFPYVITPNASASGRFLRMVPSLDGSGRGTCFEVQGPDGSLKKLWEVPWYDLPSRVFLHVSGRALMHRHEIDAGREFTEKNFGEAIVLSFWFDGEQKSTIKVKTIVRRYDAQPAGGQYFVIAKVKMMDQPIPQELGLPFAEGLARRLKEGRVFCVVTYEKEEIFFSHLGEIMNRRPFVGELPPYPTDHP